MAYRSVSQRDSIGSVHQSSTYFIYLYIYIYIHTDLQPSETMSVILYPVHRNHRLNSIRAKMKNDNEIEKCTHCDLNDLVHMKMHSLR